VRIPLDRIDALLNLAGELVVTRVKSTHKASSLRRMTHQMRSTNKLLAELHGMVKDALDVTDEFITSGQHLLRASPEQEKAAHVMAQLHTLDVAFREVHRGMTRLSDEMQGELFQLGPVIDELQRRMKEIRMLPLATLFDAFPRLVRDLSREQGKDVRLIVTGETTELDKKVIEAINGPLIHLLRNAVDHGMEPAADRATSGKPPHGTVALSASQEGGKVVITVSDDGPGLDPANIADAAIQKGLTTAVDVAQMSPAEILELVFTKGFSTARFVTDLSGRGVGLDVVRTDIERLKGTVTLNSTKGAGATIRIALPLTVAVMSTLLVEAGGHPWAFHLSNVAMTAAIPTTDIATIEQRMIAQIQGRSIPLVPLGALLGLPTSAETTLPPSGAHQVVIVQTMGRRIGFVVEKIRGEEEVLIKGMGPHLGKVKGIAGATMLASGEVLAILDPQDLVQMAESTHPHVQAAPPRAVHAARKRILVVEDSLTTRELERAILENSGYDVDIAIDGLEALDKLTRHRFDAVISDIKMPRMDGFELCRVMRTNDALKHLPVIFVTSLSHEEEKRKGLEVGAQAYLTKGQFDQRNLLEALERLV
jgi:two-component system chemotaxis sensor kinase CheA